MKQKKLILLVEDEASIADSILYVFKSEGYEVQWINEGLKALEWLEQRNQNIDFIILDVGLPDITGFELCKLIRKNSSVPILFLTARSDEIDRVVGLEIGADDYMVKPFSPRELTARVRAILRRSNTSSNNEKPTISSNKTSPLEFDKNKKTASYYGHELNLTRAEYQILFFLNQHPGWKYSREQIMEHTSEDPDMASPRVIDSHVKSIRAKLAKINSNTEVIITHRGFGYALREDW